MQIARDRVESCVRCLFAFEKCFKWIPSEMNNFNILIRAPVPHDNLTLTPAEITQFRLPSFSLLIRKKSCDSWRPVIPDKPPQIRRKLTPHVPLFAGYARRILRAHVRSPLE